MWLVILGVVIVFIGFVMANVNSRTSHFGKPVMALGVLAAVIGFFAASVVQVDAGEIGVKKLFGNVQPDVLHSGLHMVNPFMNVVPIETRTQNYTMSGVHSEGNQPGDDAIRVLSADGLEVTIDLTVLFRVLPERAPQILKQIGEDYRDRIVRPIARTRIRDNAVYYDAVSLYSTKRDEFQTRIYKSMSSPAIG